MDNVSEVDSECTPHEKTGTYVAGVRMDAFTYDDFHLMLDALTSLEKQAGKEFMIKSMIGLMTARSDERRDAVAASMEETNYMTPDQRRLVEEIAILRAKLLLARRGLDVTEAARAFADCSAGT